MGISFVVVGGKCTFVTMLHVYAMFNNETRHRILFWRRCKTPVPLHVARLRARLLPGAAVNPWAQPLYTVTSPAVSRCMRSFEHMGYEVEPHCPKWPIPQRITVHLKWNTTGRNTVQEMVGVGLFSILHSTFCAWSVACQELICLPDYMCMQLCKSKCRITNTIFQLHKCMYWCVHYICAYLDQSYPACDNCLFYLWNLIWYSNVFVYQYCWLVLPETSSEECYSNNANHLKKQVLQLVSYYQISQCRLFLCLSVNMSCIISCVQMLF